MQTITPKHWKITEDNKEIHTLDAFGVRRDYEHLGVVYNGELEGFLFVSAKRKAQEVRLILNITHALSQEELSLLFEGKVDNGTS